MIKNDVCSEIDLIVKSLPENLTDLEKVRWLYIKLGKVFSYNLDVLLDDNVYINDVVYIKGAPKPIDKFQTCHQISSILVQILSDSVVNVKSKIVTREIPQRNYFTQHEAVAIFLDNGEKYLLDLTLDLFLIQSDCQTKEFGYSTDSESTYDILSLKETEKIDEKLNIKPKNGYLDNEIKNFKQTIKDIPFNEQNFDTVMEKIFNKFNFCFSGVQEGKQFINKIWNDIFPPVIINGIKEYNIFHNDENDSVQVVSVYLFKTNLFEKCYLYDNNSGLFITSPNKVIEMLDDGWNTRSTTLEDDLFEMIDKFKKTR